MEIDKKDKIYYGLTYHIILFDVLLFTLNLLKKSEIFYLAGWAYIFGPAFKN